MRSKSITHPVPYLRGDSVCHTQCDLTGMVNVSPHSTSDLGAYSNTIKSLSECNLLLLQIVNILQIITVFVFLVITTVIVFVTVITAFITFVVCVISRKRLLKTIYGLLCQTHVKRATSSPHLQLLTYKQCYK